MFLKNMLRRTQGNEKGFTLVELLIVVSIITILAAIAIPQFLIYKKQGYAATINADAKNAYTSARAYLIGNHGAVLNDCTNIINGGYQQSPGTTCAASNFQESAGSITIAGNAIWGLSVNSATISYNGNLTLATP